MHSNDSSHEKWVYNSKNIILQNSRWYFLYFCVLNCTNLYTQTKSWCYGTAHIFLFIPFWYCKTLCNQILCSCTDLMRGGTPPYQICVHVIRSSCHHIFLCHFWWQARNQKICVWYSKNDFRMAASTAVQSTQYCTFKSGTILSKLY